MLAPAVDTLAPIAAPEQPALAPAPAPAPIDITPAIVVPVVAAADLGKTLAESGLVLVQTSSVAVVVAEPEPPVRLGRPRKAKTGIEQNADAPLMMVETQK
jgi:ribonuclease E